MVLEWHVNVVRAPLTKTWGARFWLDGAPIFPAGAMFAPWASIFERAMLR